MTFTKTYIEVDIHKVVNEGRWWNMDVDMCYNRRGVKALKPSSFGLRDEQWVIVRTIKFCGE